jgi:hypothetical protein
MSFTLKGPWVMDDGNGSGSASGSRWVPQLGVVVALDRDKGEITLVRPGGAPSCFTAHARLLTDVRIWGVVQVVTEGTVIRGLRCL